MAGRLINERTAAAAVAARPAPATEAAGPGSSGPGSSGPRPGAGGADHFNWLELMAVLIRGFDVCSPLPSSPTSLYLFLGGKAKFATEIIERRQ